MWRPKEWEKILDKIVDDNEPGDGYYTTNVARAAEVGANAMLEALRGQGLKTPGYSGYYLKRLIDGRKGSLVFIPDEVE